MVGRGMGWEYSVVYSKGPTGAFLDSSSLTV
jgi:hypothetical protein